MTHNNPHTIIPIGIIHTPFKQKFGTPRQSGLVHHARGIVKLNHEFTLESVRGLEEYDYIWLQFIFHQVVQEGYGQMVRPPRLGGKIKKGIFATRSPHRPNHLGLSLVRLEEIYIQEQVHLVCSGVDLVDGTPIFDIKPYLAHIESQPQAKSGFSTQHLALLNVQWLPESKQGLQKTQMHLIEEIIAQDPRPATQHQRDKTFVMHIHTWQVYFYVQDSIATITAVKQI